MKLNLATFAIIVVLIFSLLIRFFLLDYPSINTSKWGDATRDYLTAHYIKNGERPLVGPYNPLNKSGIKNSPFYYYLLSLFLVFKDDLLTLSVINIILQVLTIFLIYLISKEIFGEITGLISTLFFSILPEVIKHTELIWQPYLMEPFAYLGLLFLILAYTRKSYKFLILSWIIIPMAFTLHNSVFAWLPQLAVITFFILRSQKKSFKHYLGVFFAASSVIIYYIPSFVYLMMNTYTTSLEQSIYVTSLDNYFHNFIFRMIQFLQIFSIDVRFIFVFALLLFVYFKNQDLKKNLYLSLCLSFILSPIFFAAFLNKDHFHYLILSIGSFCIVFAETINFILSRIFPIKILVVLLLAIFFYANF